MKRILLPLLLPLLLVAALVTPVSAGVNDGTIEGRLLNTTPDGTPVAGQEVTLHVLEDLRETDVQTVAYDDRGGFTFEGLNTGATFNYRVETVFQGVTYDSGLLQFTAGETVIPWEILVSDTTTEDGDVRAAMAHVIIGLDEGFLDVTEFYLFMNDGDRAYVGAAAEGEDHPQVLRFTVPDGTAGLNFSEGLSEIHLRADGTGFSDAAPLLPAGREVVFHYMLDITAGQRLLNLKFQHPVSSFNFLVQDMGVTVNAPALTVGEPLQIEENRYLLYSGQDIAAEETLPIRLEITPPPPEIGAWVWALLILAAGTVCILLWRWRYPHHWSTGPGGETAAPEADA